MSNKRTDKYDGSFENQVHLALKIVNIIRQNMPAEMPLFFWISGTEWLEHLNNEPSWDVQETIRLAQLLAG